MNYSLIGAGSSHLKIVAVALICSGIVWFTIYSSQAASGIQTAPATVSAPQLIHEQSAAHVQPASVCRITAL